MLWPGSDKSPIRRDATPELAIFTSCFFGYYLACLLALAHNISGEFRSESEPLETKTFLIWVVPCGMDPARAGIVCCWVVSVQKHLVTHGDGVRAA